MAKLYDFSMSLDPVDGNYKAYPGLSQATNLPVIGVTASGREHQLYLTDGKIYGTKKTYSDMDLMADFHRMGSHQQVTVLIPKDTTGLWDALEKAKATFGFSFRAWNMAKSHQWHAIYVRSRGSYLYGRRRLDTSEALIVKFEGAEVQFSKDRKTGDPSSQDFYPSLNQPRSHYPN
jgi:hypothetical protein